MKHKYVRIYFVNPHRENDLLKVNRGNYILNELTSAIFQYKNVEYRALVVQDNNNPYGFMRHATEYNCDVLLIVGNANAYMEIIGNNEIATTHLPFDTVDIGECVLGNYVLATQKKIHERVAEWLQKNNRKIFIGVAYIALMFFMLLFLIFTIFVRAVAPELMPGLVAIYSSVALGFIIGVLIER